MKARNRNAITSFRFGFVEACVSNLQQFLAARCVLRKGGDANGKRNGVQYLFLVGNLELFGRLAQLFYAHGCALRRGFWKNDRKFLSSKTANYVLTTEVLLEEPGHGSQYSIPCIVAVNVIESLEVIEIEKHNGERLTPALRPLQLPAESILHEPAV